jgi:regulator of protease activity HflC (stomatin/prohibitin superfamily)|uniref:Band 7 domain-containing protein n=1 Tax=Anaerolinea thermolimosa TaxID=229919 RepID=A0A7C4KJE5_9CHLR
MNVQSLTQILVGITWIAVVIAFVVVVMRASRNQPTHGSGRIIGGLILLALVFTTMSSGLVFINPEERGVVISAIAPKGYREQALEPGLKFVVPFAETVVRYPISRQTYTMSIATSEGAIKGDDSIAARTADGQEILVDASVIYQIDPAKVVQVHIQWQDRYMNDLVRPQARGIIRDVVSQFGVEEVVSSKRDEMVNELNSRMAKKLEENGFILVDFVLRNITFSPEYAASVEQKQIAEQQAQQARFVVETKRQEAEQARQIAQGQADAVVIKAKADAEARIIQAEAEAKSLELISNALKENPDLLNYQYITKLSPNLQVMLLPANSPFLLPFPGQLSTPTPTPEAQPQP